MKVFEVIAILGIGYAIGRKHQSLITESRAKTQRILQLQGFTPDFTIEKLQNTEGVQNGCSFIF